MKSNSAADAGDASRRDAAAAHPLVQAILTAFPGAKIAAVNDTRLDAYGLLPEPADATPADMPDFAPDDADYVDELPEDWDQ